MNNIPRTCFLLATSILLGAAGFAQAAGTVTVTGGVSLPTENVLYSQLLPNIDGQSSGGEYWRWRVAYDAEVDPVVRSDRQDQGQFFDITEPTIITGFGVFASSGSKNSAEHRDRHFTLSIVEVSGLSSYGGMLTTSTITEVTSFQGLLPHLGTGGYVQFDFDAYTLDAPTEGSRYAFLLAFDEVLPAGIDNDVGNFFLMRTIVPEVSNPGFRIAYNENNNDIPVHRPLVSSGDGAYRGWEHYILGSAVIPEPSHYAMGAGLLMLLIAFLRRRRS